jgi:DNA-binding MarR family transcriptional regulator
MNQMPFRTGPEADGVDLGWLPESIGFLASMAQAQVYGFFMADLGAHGLRPAEFSALLVIGRNPGIRQGVLARSLRFKRAHMTKLIRSFESRGYVSREIPNDDRRSVELRLTEHGARFIRDHESTFRGSDDRRPTPLTPRETDQLRDLLGRFVGLKGGPAA